MRGRLPLLVASTVAVAAAVVGAATLSARAQEVVPASAHVTEATATPTDDAATAAATASARTRAAEALEALDGDVAVAVMNVDSGATFVHGSGRYDTASIVKLDMVAALMLRQHGELTTDQYTWAAAALRRSDNPSASALYNALGGASGLDAANADLGLVETTAGANGNWGLTQTTAADQLRLLKAVFGEDSPLSAQAQRTLRALMAGVSDTQRFGVTAASDNPSSAMLKVGYLQRSTTGLWDVSSIGRIERNGHQYLVAVLSEHSTTFKDGVTLVESAARAGVAAMAG
jgi:hypothetical protein